MGQLDLVTPSNTHTIAIPADCAGLAKRACRVLKARHRLFGRFTDGHKRRYLLIMFPWLTTGFIFPTSSQGYRLANWDTYRRDRAEGVRINLWRCPTEPGLGPGGKNQPFIGTACPGGGL